MVRLWEGFFMRHILISLLAFLVSSPAWAAYYGVLDNGEVLGEGKYKLTTDVQALTKNGGLNLGAMGEMGFQEDFGVKALIGFGKTDFYGGAMFKWMPIPDLENQPAIGVNLGVIYANDEDVRDLSFRAEPMVSKRLSVDETVFTPYVSLPVSVRVRNTDDPAIEEETRMTFQLVLGSQLQIAAYKNLQFIAEIGLDLDQAPGYVSMGAVWYFDRENGFTLE
jgi:hypothetical protein